MLPTDASGKYIFPVVNLDGQLLPTDPIFGHYLDPVSGEPLATDDFGRPLDNDSGKTLSTNAAGIFIFPRRGIMTTPTTRQQDVVYFAGESQQKASTSKEEPPFMNNDEHELLEEDNNILPIHSGYCLFFSFVEPEINFVLNYSFCIGT
jgi:hypothetical protein